MPKAHDPRWVLLAETGEYSTLGRYREPEAEDIAVAEKALMNAGKAGWIAVMSASVHHSTSPDLVMVRPLCSPNRSFAEAVELFRSRL
jgi:hypothetical protein